MQHGQLSDKKFENIIRQKAIPALPKNVSSFLMEEGAFSASHLHCIFYFAFSALLAILILLPVPAYSQSGTAQIRGSQNTSFSPILVGMEYAPLDNLNHLKKQAKAFGEIGAPAVKLLPEGIRWELMQKSPKAKINFKKLDAFVKEYQANGFTDLVVAFKSHSSWASKDHSKLNSKNPSPKPEYMPLYENWVYSVVERYDGDGKDDMPGLQFPVKYYEIGVEFSSYEPEPPEDYLEMLEVAYKAAHRAYSDVMIAHVAFLTTTVFKNNPSPEEYEAAFAEAPARFMEHSLADHRKILDRPDIFDIVNFHSLGNYYEIEENVRWLKYEMARRRYEKPIIISDTTPASFIGWGPATVCNKPAHQMGLLARPATEADRCRLAEYFNKLIDKDETTLRWTQGFVAEDMVKRVIVSAEQKIALINTSFMEDILWLKIRLSKAGAGVSAWGGMADYRFGRKERRAGFYSLQQLMRFLTGYNGIQRLSIEDAGLYVYRLSHPKRSFWIAWYDPGHLVLPGDTVPEKNIELPVSGGKITIEEAINKFEQTVPDRMEISAENDIAHITLRPTPVYIY